MAEDSLTQEQLILRDHLALDRTRLANERTLLAYIRTALMLLVAGATAVKFVGETQSVIIAGWLFIAAGILVGAFGAWRFVAIQRAINRRTDH
jgi:putative membrane protein